MLVAMASPAFASSARVNPDQTYINNNGQFVVSTAFSGDNQRVTGNDSIVWYNWWSNQYGGSYTIKWGYQWAGGSQSINSATTPDKVLSQYEAYSADKTIPVSTGTLYKFHQYNGVNTPTIYTTCY